MRRTRLARRAELVHEAIMDRNAVEKLSEMQIACLRLVADLKKTEQIAGELGISPSTVNTHIERAIARLQVANRREAARLVVAHLARNISGDDLEDTSNRRPQKRPTEELPLSTDATSIPILGASTTALGRRRNDLTVSQRLFLALFVLVLLCIGIGGLGAAIEQLSHWRAAAGAHQ